ncbi:hypothetical protein [Corynebacterium otitidis]
MGDSLNVATELFHWGEKYIMGFWIMLFAAIGGVVLGVVVVRRRKLDAWNVVLAVAAVALLVAAVWLAWPK